MDYFCAWLCVFFLCFLYLQLVSASSCDNGPYTSLRHVRKHAMTMNEFDTYVADRELSRIYLMYHNTTYVRKTINHRAMWVFKERDAYKKTTTYNWKKKPKCQRFPSTHLNVHDGKASFYYAGGYKYTVFYSSCPSTYVLMFECDPIEIRSGFKKCRLEDIRMSIFKPEAVAAAYPDDIPWYLIVKDMYNVTGIKFGCESYEWLLRRNYKVLKKNKTIDSR